MTVRIERLDRTASTGPFREVARTVYRDDPNGAGRTEADLAFLLSDRNPFYHHAEAACFLALDGERPVGRVAAIVDRNHINYHQEQAGFFGFYECLPDQGAADLLLQAVAEWLRRRDIDILRGPVNPSTNESCGFLLEGYDLPPAFMTAYNPPYYHGQMERSGLGKARDLYAYRAALNDITSIDRLERIAAGSRRKMPDLGIRHIDPRHLGRELSAIKDIYNSALGHQWGFVPLTSEEIDALAERLDPVIDPELVLIAERKAGPVGFLMSVPDRLPPPPANVGARKHPEVAAPAALPSIRVMTAGIREEHRRKGIDAVLYLEAFRAAVRKGFRTAEMSGVLEDNVLMQRGCEIMGGKLARKFRIYEKQL